MTTRNIIVPCDGTWNGLTTMTNVRRLANIMSGLPPPRRSIQNVFPPNGFFEGVGIGRGIPEFILNGAVAGDLGWKIKEAYKFIVTNYREKYNNRVWLFGFSRGAYTVRSVAGMIRNCGIVRCGIDNDSSLDVAIDQAYDIYRNRGQECHPDGPVAKEFRVSFSHPESDSSIVFMGLWDTVGAHGLPSYKIGSGFEYLEFYDQFVSSSIDHTYQALAVHENISNFAPCRVFKHDGATNVVVEQWFPGIHIDIGGFVQNNPISDVTLNWMIENINNADIKNTNAPALGRLIPLVDVASGPAGMMVRIARTTVKRSLPIARIAFKDRVIPGLDANVLYNGGEWNDIARARDYSSHAYNVFRSLFELNNRMPPPELL